MKKREWMYNSKNWNWIFYKMRDGGDWSIWKIIQVIYFCFSFFSEKNVTDEKFLRMRKKVILIGLRRSHQMENDEYTNNCC